MSPALLQAVHVGPAVAARPAAPDSAAGWQRAMEGAGRLAWFHGPSAATAGAGTALPHRSFIASGYAPSHALPRTQDPDAWRAGQGPRLRATVAKWSAPVVGRSLAGVVTNTAGHAATFRGTSDTALLAALTQGVHSALSEGARGAPPLLPVAIQPETPNRPGSVLRPVATLPVERQHVSSRTPGIRIHVEATPQGLMVWLGIDAELAAQGARTAALAAEMRRLLSNSGQRVASVICNGTLIDVADSLPTLHQEP